MRCSIIENCIFGVCGQFCPKIMTIFDHFGHVDKNFLAKHPFFIPDLVREMKSWSKNVICTEKTSFKCFNNFGQKVTNF